MELVMSWCDSSMVLPVAAVAAAFVRPEWLQPHRASLAAAVPAAKLRSRTCKTGTKCPSRMHLPHI